MRRFVLALIATCVVAMLLLPAAASAGTWAVKNPSGTKIGKVSRVSKNKCVLYDRKGRRCGRVEWNADIYGYIAHLGYPKDTGVRRQAVIIYGTAFNGWFVADLDYEPIGWCKKASGKWVVKREKTGRVVGRVSARCPQWAAAGAVYALNTRWKWPY